MSFPLNKKIKNPINTKIIDIRKLNLRPIKEIIKDPTNGEYIPLIPHVNK
jgi:hypothetical protein